MGSGLCQVTLQKAVKVGQKAAVCMRRSLTLRSRSSHQPDGDCLTMIRNEPQRTGPSRLRSLRTRVLVLFAIAMLAFPAFAAAGSSPTTDQDKDIQVSTGGGGSTDPDGLGGNVGPLPFTGFDVIAMVAVALAVTGVGLALQRAVARESTEEL